MPIVQKYLLNPARAETAMCHSGGNFTSPTAVLTEETGDVAEMLFFRWTKVRIRWWISAISANTLPRTENRAARNAAMERTRRT